MRRELIPNPSRSVTPTGFLSLPTLFSAPHVRGLISSHRPRAGFRPVQGFLSPRSAPSLIGRSCPLVVVCTTAHRPKPAATSVHLDFEALIRAEPRALRFGISRPVSRSPHRVSVSSRLLPLLAVNSRYREPSAYDVPSDKTFTREGNRLTRCASSVLSTRSPAYSVSRLPTCSKLSSRRHGMPSG
jgi:hypothetical protein